MPGRLELDAIDLECRRFGFVARHGAGAAPTVLLVEEEVLIRHLVAVSLSEHGFTVHRGTTVDEGLGYTHAGAETDCLFTDFNLSGSMNGAELAVQVRQLRPGSADRVCLRPLSAHRYRNAGASRVAKSYDLEEVDTLVTRLTGRSRWLALQPLFCAGGPCTLGRRFWLCKRRNCDRSWMIVRLTDGTLRRQLRHLS